MAVSLQAVDLVQWSVLFDMTDNGLPNATFTHSPIPIFLWGWGLELFYSALLKYIVAALTNEWFD
jgi:hypothetical protein